jgi:hypothetical protein
VQDESLELKSTQVKVDTTHSNRKKKKKKKKKKKMMKRKSDLKDEDFFFQGCPQDRYEGHTQVKTTTKKKKKKLFFPLERVGKDAIAGHPHVCVCVLTQRHTEKKKKSHRTPPQINNKI